MGSLVYLTKIVNWSATSNILQMYNFIFNKKIYFKIFLFIFVKWIK